MRSNRQCPYEPKRGGLFDQYQELAETMWKESRPVVSTSVSGSDQRTRALVLSSGSGTEVLDPANGKWGPSIIAKMNGRWKAVKGAQWVSFREEPTLESAITGGRYRFRQSFRLPRGKASEIVRGDLFVRADDTCHLTVNGKTIGQEFGGADFEDPFTVHLSEHLVDGENTVEFEVLNYAKPNASAPEDNPLGLIYRLHVEYPE